MLFRGSPSCGKSTYIKQEGLEPYTLSADDIRLELSSPVLVDGVYRIDQSMNAIVWGILYERLTKRMNEGLFTVLDATNSLTSQMEQFLNYATTYGYTVKLIDMSSVPKEVCIERNAIRVPEYKRVPEKVIHKMYARFKTQKIPDGIMVFKYDLYERAMRSE